jgi:hypothetical protein
MSSHARREWTNGDWITCSRCEGQKYDRGSCSLCGNLGILDENGERLHCDCRACDWVEGDNGAIRCERCGGYAGTFDALLDMACVLLAENQQLREALRGVTP